MVTKEERNAQLKAWRDANPDKVKTAQQRHYQKNCERMKASSRAYAQANAERIKAINKASRDRRTPEQVECERVKKLAATMKRRYGITEADYLTMLKSQQGHCALCYRTPNQERYFRLNIDHCHRTGKVRGLLCTPCNHAIGQLGDSAEHLQKAVAYLSR